MTTTTTQTNNTTAAWDETHDSRETFLALLQAQCAPGQTVGPIPTTGRYAEPELETAAALLLALLDPSTSLAIEGQPNQNFDWLYVATGAPVASVAEADFVLSTHDLAGVIAAAKRGTPEQPEQGATVIFAGPDTVAAKVTATISGPGIEQPRKMAVPMSDAAIEARAVANVAYPMGIDIVITRGDQLLAFPRSTQIRLEGAENVRGNA